jgi:hypothetical protein
LKFVPKIPPPELKNYVIPAKCPPPPKKQKKILDPIQIYLKKSNIDLPNAFIPKSPS